MKKVLLTFFILLFCTTPAFAAPQTAHIIVALCDNIYQGIVPVPHKIGNGDDPENNLYWGAMYGFKTYLRKSGNWILVEEIKNPEPNILRRAIFKHKTKDTWIIADAYQGSKIKQATIDFFNFTAGKNTAAVKSKDTMLNMGGSADLIGYIGHNGLMDFTLSGYPQKEGSAKDAMVLACL